MKQFLPILFFIISISAYSQVVKLSTNITFQFVEGPVWNGKGALYFSDMNAKKVYKYIPGKGFSVIRTGQTTNGMAIDSTGNLMVCEQGPTNQVVQMDTLGVVKKVLVNKYNNKGFNNPNDLCIDKKGGIYFSDPTWGTQPQDKQAIYYIKPGGECIRISGDFQKPNGICLSPDKKLLYVDDSNDKNVSVFDVQPDGTAINKRVFCVLKANPGAVSGADGMRVDSQGTLYIASAVGIQVFDKNGVAKKIIPIPETPTNVAFGGKDLKTLYITAGTSLYSTQVDISGNPLYTSVPEMKTQNLVVFPNPTNRLLHFDNENFSTFQVFNSSGVEVLRGKIQAGKRLIDLSSVQNGWYMVKFEGDKNTYAAKVLVQK